MVQTQISLPEIIMGGIKRDAAKLGVTPNVFMRIQLCAMFSTYTNKDEAKSYIVKLENWREVEAYTRVKGLGLETFMAKSAEAMMRRNALTTAQKDEVKRILEK
jgi:hypothetical protein